LPDAPAVLIGKLADGSYLFSDSEYCATGGQEGYLYALDLGKKTQRLFHLKRGDDAHLAPSRDKLVQTTSPDGDQTQPKFKPPSIVDVWVMELGSGKQSKLFSFSAPDFTNSKGPWMNLIGWFEDQ